MENKYKPSVPIQVGGWQDTALIDAFEDGVRADSVGVEINGTEWLTEYRKTHSPIPDKRIEEFRESDAVDFATWLTTNDYTPYLTNNMWYNQKKKGVPAIPTDKLYQLFLNSKTAS